METNKKIKKHYRYSTLENMRFVYAGAAKWQPVVIVCTVLLAVTEGLKDFVWIYGGKKIIEILENIIRYESPFWSILWIVVIGAVTEGLLFVGMQVSQTTASSRITDIRCQFVLMTNRKVMKMPYVMMDNPEVGRTKRKCDESTANMTEGMEGLLRESAHFFSQVIMMLTAAGILFYLNPLLVLVLFILSMANGLIHNRMNRYEKEEYHDKMIPVWRENYYYYSIASDFEYAKDIRIFNMQDGIGEKQQRLWDIMYIKNKILQNKWILTFINEGLIGFL